MAATSSITSSSVLTFESPFVSTLEEYDEKLKAAVLYISERLPLSDVALVLGSGLQDFERQLRDTIVINYADIPGMPRPKVVGHPGRFISGLLPSGRRILCLAGRSHPYEGYPAYVLAYPPRLLAMLGVKVFIATNAAGGGVAKKVLPPGSLPLNTPMMPGNLMIITDHVNVMRRNPLEELTVSLGAHYFPAASVHSPRLAQIARQTSINLRSSPVAVFEGTYASFSGPTYETANEVETSTGLGVSAFGMSTVPDLLIATACGLECLAISLCTNQAAGVSGKPLSHEEVTQTGLEAAKPFETYISSFLSAIPVQPVTPRTDIIPPLIQFTSAGIHSRLLPDYPLAPTHDQIQAAATFLRSNLNLESGIDLHAIIVGPPHSSSVADLQEHLGVATAELSAPELLKTIPHFPATSPAGFSGSYTLVKSQNLFVFHTNDHLGFSSIEALFIAEVLSQLKLSRVSALISTGSQDHAKLPVGSVVFVDDVFDTTTFFTVVPRSVDHPWYASPLLAQQSGNQLPAHPLAFFNGPTYPTPAELQLPRASGISLSSITRSAIFSALASSGIAVQVYATVDYLSPEARVGEPHSSCLPLALTSLFNSIKTPVGTVDDHQLIVPSHPEFVIAHRLARPVFQGEEAYIEAQTELIKTTLLKDLPSTPPIILLDRVFNSLPSFDEIAHHDIPLFPDTVGPTFSRLSLGRFSGLAHPVLLLQAAPPEHSGASLGLLMAPVRIACLLKPKVILSILQLVTNEKNPHHLGSLLALTDHVNLSGRNPLFGSNIDKWGSRFFDVQSLYNPKMTPILKTILATVLPSSRTTAGIALYGIGPIFRSSSASRVLDTAHAHGWACANIPEHLVIHHMHTPLVALGVIANALTKPSLQDAVSVVGQFLSQVDI